MSKDEAIKKLSLVSPTKAAWYKNEVLTWEKAYMLVLDCVRERKDGDLPEWLEKRVYQVLRNKKINKCANCGHIYE